MPARFEAINLHELRARIGGVVNAAGTEWRGPGPGHSSHDNSLHVSMTRDGCVLWHSFAGDTPDAVNAHLGLAHVRSPLRLGTCSPRHLPRGRRIVDVRESAARIACAAALWTSGTPLARTVGEIYLRRARAIGAPLHTASLRFLPDAPFAPYAPDHRRHPAIIAAVVDAAGCLCGAHLTYLRIDGSGKADLPVPRKMVGQVGGGHVALIPGARLVVAEGIESTLSAWEAAVAQGGGVRAELGAVAGLSAGGLAAMMWPADTTGLVIAPDHDPNGAGEHAAEALARRAGGAGLAVAFLTPPERISDWNAFAMRELLQ